jgi:hypothetical protein
VALREHDIRQIAVDHETVTLQRASTASSSRQAVADQSISPAGVMTPRASHARCLGAKKSNKVVKRGASGKKGGWQSRMVFPLCFKVGRPLQTLCWAQGLSFFGGSHSPSFDIAAG